MTDLVAILILLLIMFGTDWVFALWLHRLNRRASADLAKSLGMLAEIDGHLVDVIDDLRGIQPEKDEILEISALQIRSLCDSAKDQQKAMERMSTKLPFWIHLVPLSVVAKRQLVRRSAQRRRTQKLNEWQEDHDPDAA